MVVDTKPQEKKLPVHKSIYLLPNLITSLSMFMGFLSMVWAVQSRFEEAGLAIVLSALLDGMDGLLGGVSLFDFATMALVCVSLAAAGGANASNLLNTAIFAGAMVGALMGFLRYNSNPARVFMGDVGSFFIGGALVGICVVTRLSLLLPIIALAMVMSSVSDIIQISYFKYTRIKTGTGKRIFRMAPMHYHFELGGMPETQVVAMYYIVTVVLCLIALLGFVG